MKLASTSARVRSVSKRTSCRSLRTRAEVDAGFKSGAGYRDPEQSDGLHRMSNRDRESYKQQSRAHFDGVAGSCRQNNIVHYEACIEQELGAVLRSWLRLAGARAK